MTPDSPLKAIETRYNGYRFRSRLEARWAVLFDALGVEYRYEDEGFDLDGIRYLPDFFIPEWDAFVEVKADAAQDIDKVLRLVYATSRKVLLCVGVPDPREWNVALSVGGAGGRSFTFGALATCASGCGLVSWIGSSDEHSVLRGRFAAILSRRQPCATCFVSVPLLPVAMYEAARGARFEHGETPLGPRTP